MTTPNSHHSIVIDKTDKLYEQIEVVKQARRYHAAGLGLIPLRCDGSKAPKISWRHLTKTQPPYSDYWFSKYDTGIGILCGKPSGGLEVLDFDDMQTFEHWLSQCTNDLSFIKSLPIIRTPRPGIQIYYRAKSLTGNEVLARSPDGKTLIETRGQGGYVVGVGSPPSVHPTGKPYQLIQGDVCDIPEIWDSQRLILLTSCRKLDQSPKPVYLPAPQIKHPTPPINQSIIGLPVRISGQSSKQGVRPYERAGDRFNRTATWEAILEPHGASSQPLAAA